MFSVMWWLLVGAGLLSLAALPAASQSLPSKKEAAVVLQKAADATDLRAPDTPPFHLVAHVHHESAGYRADGVYELLWASPDRYRENFTMQVGQDTIAESDVAWTDKFYTARNTPVESLSLWRVRRTVRSIHRFFFGGDKAKVRRVYSATGAGKMLICFDAPLSNEDQKSRTCFDPSTLKAVSLSLKTEPPPLSWPGPTRAAVADSEVQAEFSDFTDVGEKRYPRHINLREFGDAVEVRVDVLDRVAEFGSNVFVPSPESVARDWCSEPVTKGIRSYPLVPPVTMSPPLRLIAYYVLVGRGGRVEKSAPLHPAIKGVDSQVESWLASVRYPVDLCNGKPIEYEIVIQPPLHIQY